MSVAGLSLETAIRRTCFIWLSAEIQKPWDIASWGFSTVGRPLERRVLLIVVEDELTVLIGKPCRHHKTKTYISPGSVCSVDLLGHATGVFDQLLRALRVDLHILLL